MRPLAFRLAGPDDADRGTVLLHFVDGLSTKEIADRSGEPWATVRSRRARGLDRLRAALARYNSHPRSRARRKL